MSTHEITIRIKTTARGRKIIGRRGQVWEAEVGDVTATTADGGTIDENLALQLRAIALHPAPMYRRLPDGRGLIIRITGALVGDEHHGVLTYTLERFHPDGSTGGATLSHFSVERDGRRVTVDSRPYEVEGLMRRVIDRELARYQDLELHRAQQSRALADEPVNLAEQRQTGGYLP